MPTHESSGTEANSQGINPRDRYFVKIILLFTAITYLGSSRFGFVNDIDPQVLSNPFIKSWQYLPQYFTSAVWKQMFPLMPGNFYRPLFLIWTRVNYALFSDHPFGWHVMAISLHVLVTWCVYLVVRRLTGQFTLAWMTALIFGVHPVHHEVVAWIPGTTESLAAVFVLAAFLAYLRSIENEKTFWMALSCGLYALGLLSNETTIVMPALVFAHSWISGNFADPEQAPGYGSRFSKAFSSMLWYFPVAFVYLFARHEVLSGRVQASSNVSVWTWFITLPSIALFYVKSWLIPVRYSEYYDLFYQTRPNLGHVVLPALILAVLAYSAWMLRNRIGARDAGYAAAWLIIPLLPGLDTFAFKSGELVHDRYFYMPSFGAALLVALIVTHLLKQRPLVFGQPVQAVAAALALAMVLAFCTIRATQPWGGDKTLYLRAHEVAPLNAAATNGLEAELISERDIQDAQKLQDSSHMDSRGDFESIYNLARLRYFERQLAQSEQYTRKALALDPNSADSYILLGQIELKQNAIAGAQDAFRHAVELSPYNASFHTSYGIVLELHGDCADAIPQFNEALELSPKEGLTERELSRCRTALAVTPAASKQ